MSSARMPAASSYDASECDASPENGLGATFGELELWRRNVGGLESPLGLPGRDVAEKRPDGSRRELRRERQELLAEENIRSPRGEAERKKKQRCES